MSRDEWITGMVALLAALVILLGYVVIKPS